LQYVQDNYLKAICVAERGYLIAKSKFNADERVHDFMRFIES